MAEKKKFQAIKGTRYLLPPETELWNRVEQTAREVFGTFGFGEIRPPIFESTDLFARAVGGETDIVSKEMYSFEDKPSGLPDPREVDPEDYTQAVKHAISTGQIPPGIQNKDTISALEYQLANFRSRPEE